MPLIPPRLSIPAINYGGGRPPSPTISIFTGHSHPFSPLLSLSVRIAAARCIVHNPPPFANDRLQRLLAPLSPSSSIPSLGWQGLFFFFLAAKRDSEFILLIFIIGPEIYTLFIYIYIIRNIICLQNCEAIKIIEPKKRKENVLERDNLNKR